MYRNNSKLNQGSVLVELAIVMPLVLAILLFIYWFFLTLTWQQALKDAVANAVDLAQSRGDPVSMGEESRTSMLTSAGAGLLDPIDVYVSSGTWNNTSLGTPQSDLGLLASGNNSTISGSAVSKYNEFIASQGWANTSIRDFGRQNLYAMAYAYSSIKVKAGSFVKFPCNPNGTGTGEGPGCVICGPAPAAEMAESGNTYDPATATLFGIECKMQPMDNILTPMIRMLGISGAMDLTMTATAIEENQRNVWQ